MKEEKQETQEEKPVEEKTPEQIEEPQFTAEQIKELQKELDKAKSQVNTFQGLLKDAQRKSISKDDLQPIYERLDGQQRWIATALDDFRNANSEYVDSVKTQKSYIDDAEENIKKSKEARQPAKDPDADRFFDYLGEEKLEFEDEFVQEAIKDTTNPKEALRNLKSKVKERDEAKLRDSLKSEIEKERNQLREELLKEYGLTDIGAKTPSGMAKNLKDMTPDEKLQYGFAELKKKK